MFTLGADSDLIGIMRWSIFKVQRRLGKIRTCTTLKRILKMRYSSFCSKMVYTNRLPRVLEYFFPIQVFETFRLWLPFPLPVIVSSHFRLLRSSYKGHFCCSLSLVGCRFAGCSHCSATVTVFYSMWAMPPPVAIRGYDDFLYLLHNTSDVKVS